MAAAPNHQQQYKIEELIGDGGMCKVYRCVFRYKNLPVGEKINTEKSTT